ncbi:MAG: ATP-binding cassette domain-containing protein [Betaproteobacteria bacterium]|nr:ATP-binding cassette domain-containing protein [Betaproteobacteria bacterium]
MASGTAAAVAGGFTSVIAMPNTSPVADGPNTIAWMRQRAKETGVANVFATGTISMGQKGEQLAPIGSLRQAGVVAITDDGHCVQNAELMRRALEYARMFDLPVLDHCEDKFLSAGGVMNEGKWSRILGLPAWPSIAEEVIVARNVLLSELTGARVVCQHMSSAGSIRILREARARGVPIDGEASPHHLCLTDDLVEGYDTSFKMNPPLRTRADVEEVKKGVADGTIRFLGQQVDGRPTESIVRMGMAHVPDGRGTFTALSVEENLRLGAYTRADSNAVEADIERMYQRFPRLKERYRQQAGTLSGGEQQMLAISRALMLRPKLLLLDEPSFGLAPLIVQEIFQIMRSINREEKVSMLLVEQNASLALGLADHAYLLETGKVVMAGPAAEIRADESIRRIYLGY